MTDIRTDFTNEARPLASELLDFAIKAGKPYGITDAKVEISSKQSQENDLENGVLVKAASGAIRHVSVTLYADDHILSFTKNTLDKDVLCDAMMQNMKVIHLVPRTPHNRLLEKSKVYQGPVADLDLYDPQPASTATMIDYARSIEAAAKAYPGIKMVETVSVGKDVGQSLVLATNGIDSYEAKTLYSASAMVIAEDKNGMESDYDYSTARHFADLGDPAEIGRKAAQNTVQRLGATLPATGDMPIVLDRDAATTFFNSVYATIGGTQVYRETTFMKDKLGQQVMSPEVTIVDMPQIPRGIASSQTDNAGQEMPEVTFIKDGVLQRFNLTLLQARQLGQEPMGRDHAGGGTNTRVYPGVKTPSELMADIQNGIYILGFHGGQADPNTGVFSKQAHGLIIENGKVTDKAVAGFVVSGNLKDMFMDVALANDTPPLPNTRHTLAAPTTRINKVTIAGQ